MDGGTSDASRGRVPPSVVIGREYKAKIPKGMEEEG
jgi:hypothetical protein